MGSAKDGLRLAFQQILSQVRRIPQPSEEYQFAKDIGRRWRFDFCWIPEKVAVELEGGIWIGGSHTRPVRFISDADKYNRASLDGWIVLRYTTDHLRKHSDQVVSDIKEAFAMRTHKAAKQSKKTAYVTLRCTNCGHEIQLSPDSANSLEHKQLECWKCGVGSFRRKGNVGEVAKT